MKLGYQTVTRDVRSDHAYAHMALTNVEIVAAGSGAQEQRFREDAQAAYLNTLRWIQSADSRHRDKAIAILNDWARTFSSFTLAQGTPAQQMQLEAAWILPMWANTAEIIRHYNNGEAQWPKADIDAFSGFIDKLYAEAVKANSRDSNWGASASLAMMTAGVFQNNTSRYSAGLARIKEILQATVYSSGEIFELAARDCIHPQYTLSGLTQAAEMAVIQSGDTSVWQWTGPGEASPRLAKGLEYMANAIATGSGVRDCRGQSLAAGYMDIAVNGYMNLGVAIPSFQQQAKARRPDRGSNQFLGWTTATFGRDDY